uniref:glycosyltransferase n=1 Tax=Algoriphagus sp. TaxID=1872435 RepID=UPI004048E37E
MDKSLNSNYYVSASIVLYKNNPKDLDHLFHVIFSSEIDVLYLIDNSLNNNLAFYSSYSKIIYFNSNKNVGFGAGHNIAFKLVKKHSNHVHFVINPDIIIDVQTINNMIAYMFQNKDVGMCMPKVLNFDNSTQYLTKLLPNPFYILLKKFKIPKKLYFIYFQRLELRGFRDYCEINVPVLSGCFFISNFNSLKEIGYFDERFFMYFEDWDLSRRMHLKYKTIYNTSFKVFHGHNSGANKKFNLFLIFFSSYLKYFFKHGWFFDPHRNLLNDKVLYND